MSTAAKVFENKAVFHSAMVKAGPFWGMLVGPVRDSKFPGKPAYVPFKVRGEDEGTEHTYNVENDAIRAVLEELPRNVWLRIRAEGSRDMAYINAEDANGNPILQGSPVAQPEDVPPPLWPTDAPPAATRAPANGQGDAVDRAAGMTIRAVQLLEAEGIRVDSDAAARIYNTHYIQASR